MQINIQQEVQKLQQNRQKRDLMIHETSEEIRMQQAVQYCFDNPTISQHTIARHFDVKDSKLQHEYRKEWVSRKEQK